MSVGRTALGAGDPERPSAARVYDYFLGGSHNFAVDREMARQAIEILPDLPQLMQENRAFLRRAVRYLIDVGVRQFIDIGSGIPTVGNVHEVAQEADPEARVAYVDIDPIAVAHSREILSGNPRTVVVQADLRQPEQVLGDPHLRELIDLSQPVGLLMVALLHFVPDSDDPTGLIGRYAEQLVTGSFLVVSHGSHDNEPVRSDKLVQLYARSANPLVSRSHDEIVALFNGFELVEPGVVYQPLWRPDGSEPIGEAPQQVTYGGVGRRT